MSRWLNLTLLAGAVMVAAVPPAWAQTDLARGQALYGARCAECHDRSVHGRPVRSAASFEEVRAFVVHWQREVGASWQPDEIDAVTHYLNERYYRFPCPTTVCGVPRAAVPR